MVAVGWPDDDAGAGPYRWAIEFQCVERARAVVFVGVSFYARATAETPEGSRAEAEMEAAATALGVYDYTGGPEGMRFVNQPRVRPAATPLPRRGPQQHRRRHRPTTDADETTDVRTMSCGEARLHCHRHDRHNHNATINTGRIYGDWPLIWVILTVT